VNAVVSGIDFPGSGSRPLPRSSTLTTEDQSLLSEIALGNEAALAQLYDAHSRLVYSVALRVLKDPFEAEDVMQDVFLTIWKRPETFFASRGSLAGWLAVVSRNRAIDILRKRRHTDCIDQVPLCAPDDVAGEVERRVMTEHAKVYISKLPEAQREALEMWFLQGLTHAQIAASLSAPLGTIKTRIRSALRYLGSNLQAWPA